MARCERDSGLSSCSERSTGAAICLQLLLQLPVASIPNSDQGTD